MECKDHTGQQVAYGRIETILRGKPLLNEFTHKNGISLLFSGPPGAGKTTLALYFIHEFFKELKKKDTPPQILLLSLVETPFQITEICKLYKFNFSINPYIVHLVPARFKAGEKPILRAIEKKVGLTLKPGDLLFVDGISVLGTQEIHREGLLSFLDQIKMRFLTAILVGEEYKENEDIFIKYAVDGIIKLSVDQNFKTRRIEIAKLRWHDHYLGSHAFKLKAAEYQTVQGNSDYIQFFPSIDCLIGQRPCTSPIKPDEKEKVLTSGVDGFDEIADMERKGGSFRLGDNVLLIGPNGSGKFLFGTQFLAAADSDEISICISFVRNFQEIEERISTISQTGKENEPTCHCLTFSPTGLVLEEMVGAVHNLLSNNEKNTVRLFIDGIFALRCIFNTDENFESFILSFLRLLKTFPNMVTLMSYHTPRIFASYAEINIPAGERFSMVIGFNFQEQFNRLKLGIVILKSCIKSDESLKVPSITDEGKYFIDLKAGWSRVGLLGGQREQVREERPFVKLFFENRSEEEVIERPFDDFLKRYPENYIFRKVAKHNPQPDHWSFLGYAGPGHSNTKLVVLRKYVMDVLRDRGVFMPVPEEVRKKLIDRYEDGFLWNDSNKEKDIHVMVPFYADVGVLVYQEDILEKIRKSAGTDPVKHPLSTWDDLIQMAIDLNIKLKQDKKLEMFLHKNRIHHLFVIPNTVSDAKNFVSFFFELCWTYGWQYPGSDAAGDITKASQEMEKWINDNDSYFNHAVNIIKEMIKAGKNELIPNPNIGGHYHESVFSRRWFSKIHLFPEDAENRAKDGGKKGFHFGIAPLPGIKNKNIICNGFSNVDLYSLAIIKDALAPETGWMLASSLFESEVDIQRAYLKRGIPISLKTYQWSLIKDSLGAHPKPPKAEAAFYQGQDGLFKKYVDTLNTILLPNPGNERFRRTADIPHFFEIEELLARELPRLFDDPLSDIKKVKDLILTGIKNIYSQSGRKNIKTTYSSKTKSLAQLPQYDDE